MEKLSRPNTINGKIHLLKNTAEQIIDHQIREHMDSTLNEDQ